MTAGAPLEIPTVARAQRFSISLNNVTYQFRIFWCSPAGCWMLDISTSDDTPVRSGVPLVTGADLMEQFEYLGLGGELVVQSDTDVDAVPTFSNLGTIGHLYYLPSQ